MTTAEAGRLTVRVTVADRWQTVTIEAGPDMTVRALKQRALERVLRERADGRGYIVKYRGAPVLDEGVSLAALNVPSGAPMIVLPNRRLPVR